MGLKRQIWILKNERKQCSRDRKDFRSGCSEEIDRRKIQPNGRDVELKEKTSSFKEQAELLAKENQKLKAKMAKAKEESRTYKLLKRVKYSVSKNTFSDEKKSKLNALFDLDQNPNEENGTSLRNLSI